MKYYLVDFDTFTLPTAIESGSYDDCSATLEEVAAVDGYAGYKILSEESYKRVVEGKQNG